MSSKLFVGGLSYSTTEDQLHSVFEAQGTVVNAVVILDRDSGRSRGFGFVEMANEQDASNAIDQLDGANLDGRNIMVNMAKEREPRKAVSNSRW